MKQIVIQVRLCEPGESDGPIVWTSHGDVPVYALDSASCPTNVVGSGIVSGLRRAVQDADAIRDGRDPERPSEKAIRLAEEARRS